jgi:hypothetical protein
MSTDALGAPWMRVGYVTLLLAVVAMLVVRGGVPLYDGVGFPDEPYRYVQPPAGYPVTYRPTPAHAVLRMSKGSNVGDGLLSSGEAGPQVAMFIPRGGLRVLDAARTVTVTARPLAPSSPPKDGSANSNVYEIDFGSHPTRIDAGDAAPPNITLREATFETVLAVMEYRAGTSGPWRRLETSQVGRDIYLAALQGGGQYLLVQPASGTPRSVRNEGGGYAQLLMILGFCLLVVIVLIVSVRRTSREVGPEDPP